MKKLFVLSLAMIMVLAISGFAQMDIGFKGVGAHVGYIMPEDPIDNTIGFGAQADLGTVMPNLGISAILDYWSKSYGEEATGKFTFSEMVIGALGKYYFPMNSQLKPYAGAGLGLAFGSSKVEYNDSFFGSYSASSSSTDLALFAVGGAEYPFSPNLNGFAELKYHTNGANYFGIFVGFTYMLGQ